MSRPRHLTLVNLSSKYQTPTTEQLIAEEIKKHEIRVGLISGVAGIFFLVLNFIRVHVLCQN